MRATDPATYLRVAAVQLPKTLDISVEQKAPGGLAPDEWQILRTIIDLIKTNAPGGELGPTLQIIEDALRSERAQVIEVD